MRLLILSLFILVLILPSTNMAQVDNQDVLIQLANDFRENDVSISEWNVTFKEQISREHATHTIHKLEKDFTVTESDDENSKKYHVTNTHKATKSDVTYIVIVPKNAHYASELIVSINGHKWDKSMSQAYYKQMESLRSEYFTKQSKTFACITGKVHGTISSVYFMDRIQEKYHINMLSKQTDSVENPVIKEIRYGYTPLWNEEITIDGNPINFQFVIKRATGDALEITVGTPILINEY